MKPKPKFLPLQLVVMPERFNNMITYVKSCVYSKIEKCWVYHLDFGGTFYKNELTKYDNK